MFDIAAPYSPVVYFLHTILGTLGVLLAILALSLKKGSRGHVRSGRGFVVAVAIAAVTAIAFSAVRFSPLALVSALMVIALTVSAVLALRPLSGRVRMGEYAATAITLLAWLILVLIGVSGVAISVGLIPLPPEAPPPPPLSVFLQPLIYALFPTYFLIDDLRFRRLVGTRRPEGARRHFSRMAFTLAIAIHAPIVSFSDELGLSNYLAFFGPFILWPVLTFALRRHPLLQDQGTATKGETNERLSTYGVSGVSGCGRCWPDSADDAWAARSSLSMKACLVDDSHYTVSIWSCPTCSQHFLDVTTELIDWKSGDDPAYTTVMPLTQAELVVLMGSNPPSRAVINAVGPGRRCVKHDAPTGLPPAIYWSTGIPST